MKVNVFKNSEYYKYDVIVIGAGHAGCEAALASARSGTKTLFITISLDSIAFMPCNSAIGGPGRGQLVRELDVLGGEMSRNVDRNFIHSRMLNISKGPALRAIRATVDKRQYFLSMKYILENQENLFLKQGLLVGIETNKDGFAVYTSDDNSYECRSMVICTGTFLRGKIFWGKYEREAGRQGEINSNKLVYCLERMGYKFGRLRTETPPRVDKKTINFKDLKIQRYDDLPEMFSYDNEFDGRDQVNNYITYIDRDCINYILYNIKRSSIYEKELISENPKFCPSIEDKVNRFKKRERHLVFIQPEGKDTNEMYLHGLYNTFSENIQEGIVHRIKGLEKAIITRPGYGVEYDYLLPHQIKNNLESKKHINLFFAGQINGTTGYEEAASQGIIAGLNASLGVKGKGSIIIGRNDGYIGILIDDLTTKGVSEPYRMLTSRNEFRLIHRHDNADFRMIKFLKRLGLKEKVSKIEKKYEKINHALKSLRSSFYYNKNSFIEDLKQDRVNDKDLKKIKEDFFLNQKELESLIINVKYENYIKREMKRIKDLHKFKDLKIPEDIDYRKIKDISKEAVLSLLKFKPETVNQATRLEGVRPLDVFTLMTYLNSVSRET
jgi:tRNA uridine 5-carboxymethylaminomethyl modification enzyme